MLKEIIANPMLMVTMILTLGVTFVNGWTDAPNAIATSISTRSIGVRPAILMAAVCNLFGVLVMSAFNSSVAFTIKNVANFGSDTHKALIALCAATSAIVIWAVGAWVFGIPTSESHALVAGLSGAAIALNGGIEGINIEEWLKVLEGLILSAVLGFAFGFLICSPCPEDEQVFPVCPGRSRRSYGVYAWSSGRSEVHGSYASGHIPVQRDGPDSSSSDTVLDDNRNLTYYGVRHFHRRKEDH